MCLHLSIRLLALIFLLIIFPFLAIIRVFIVIFVLIVIAIVIFLWSIFRGIILGDTVVIIRCEIRVDLDDLALISFLYLVLELALSGSTLKVVLSRLTLLLQQPLDCLLSLVKLFLLTTVLRDNWLILFIVFFGLNFVLKRLEFLFTQSGLLTLA